MSHCVAQRQSAPRGLRMAPPGRLHLRRRRGGRGLAAAALLPDVRRGRLPGGRCSEEPARNGTNGVSTNGVTAFLTEGPLGYSR